MVENYCEFTRDDGTLCCNKAVQLVIDWDMKVCYCACRKHKLHNDKYRKVINLNKFAKTRN